MTDETTYELDDKLVEVDFASQFQDSIKGSKLLKFTDDALKVKIESSKPNELLVVTSTINSPKLVEGVEIYNEEFISKSL